MSDELPIFAKMGSRLRVIIALCYTVSTYLRCILNFEVARNILLIIINHQKIKNNSIISGNY